MNNVKQLSIAVRTQYLRELCFVGTVGADDGVEQDLRKSARPTSVYPVLSGFARL